MNDENLKKFLDENTKVPRRSTNEWPELLKKIESEKKNMFLKNFLTLKNLSFGVGSFAVLAIVLVQIMGTSGTSHRVADLQDIDAFLANDSYFNEVENQYSWIDL